MIREFDSFEKVSILGQGKALGEIASIDRLSYFSDVYKEGGFATIHRVVNVNGEERGDLLLKIYRLNEHVEHAYTSIEQLHLSLKKLELKNRVPTYQFYPTLKGLPFLVFKAVDPLTNELNVGLLMYDLTRLGYRDFGDEEIRDSLVSGIEESLLFSYQLAKTVDLLHSVNFIHSDLKAASIFINSATRMISLIDFDSGFHLAVQDKPSTTGSLNGWKRTVSWVKKTVDLIFKPSPAPREKFVHDDAWAVSAAVFQFITGQNTPYSFLNTLDDDDRERYIKKAGWPNYSATTDLFNENAQQSLSEIQETLKLYEEEFELVGMRNFFEASFNAGFSDYQKVTKPVDWCGLLKPIVFQLNVAPEINSLSANKSQIDYQNELVNFQWKVSKVDFVSVDGLSCLDGNEELEVPVSKDRAVELIFHNFYTSVTQSILLKANSKFPEIEFFNSNTSIRKDESPVTLSWKVSGAFKVSVNGIKGLNLTEGEMSVRPVLPTTFKLLCEGGFGELSEAELFVDIVRPQIEEFSYEINLDHGLDNVDLKWKVTDAISVEISPGIGIVPSGGVSHVPIRDETEFTLSAKGLFFSDSKVIKAKPFPLPVVRELMVEFPRIDLNAKVNLIPLRVPDPMYRYNQIKFQNTVDALPTEINYFDGRIEFNLAMPDLGSREVKSQEVEMPRKLTFKYLLDKVSHYLKRQTNG